MGARADYSDPWSTTDQDAMFAEIDRLRSEVKRLRRMEDLICAEVDASVFARQDAERNLSDWAAKTIVAELDRLSEGYDALVSTSAAEHQRMNDLCQALSTNVTRLDEDHERDRHTIEYWKGQYERREQDYATLYSQCEDIKEQYRDCSSELVAERRHHAHLQEMCDAWMNGVADVVEPLGFDRHAACGPADLLPGLLDLEATWRLTSQVIYLEQQRWQGMAEDLWEELQEWHADTCPTQPMSPVRFRADGTVDSRTECTCHRILAVKWNELTHAADYADDGFDDATEPPGGLIPHEQGAS